MRANRFWHIVWRDGRFEDQIKRSCMYVCTYMYVHICVCVCVVGSLKLYLTIPMQLGSDVMTVSPPQSSQLGRHTYMGRTWGLSTGVFIRVGFRMVYILVGGRGTLERAEWMHAIRALCSMGAKIVIQGVTRSIYCLSAHNMRYTGVKILPALALSRADLKGIA